MTTMELIKTHQFFPNPVQVALFMISLCNY